MNDFHSELYEGQIHIRDKYQFELKHEYIPSRKTKDNIYQMDFYFFVPEALQINRETYNTRQFYQDVTCFIRFKTPDFSFQSLIDGENKKSPLLRIQNLCKKNKTGSTKEIILESKLFANIVRSRLRKEIADFLDKIKDKKLKEKETLVPLIQKMCDDLKNLRNQFLSLKKECFHQFSSKEFRANLNYVDEFISITIEDFFTEFLLEVRKRGGKLKDKIDDTLCSVIEFEYQYRKKNKFYPSVKEDKNNEIFIYRKGLLNKFILEPLLLFVERKVTRAPYTFFAASIAAGFAMFIYVYAILWGFNNLMVNSTPFIITSVLLYIVKDRLKEEIKNWFSFYMRVNLSDFTTLIKDGKTGATIGKLEETFTYIDNKRVPKEISQIRSKEFHRELTKAQRIERAFRYTKRIVLNKQFFDQVGRPYELNDIFRYNIIRFLFKASNAYTTRSILDLKTHKIKKTKCHKVYHVNIIQKVSYKNAKGEKKVEFEKIRLILDKEGIQRIEKL